MPVVAVTSLDHGRATASRHPSAGSCGDRRHRHRQREHQPGTRRSTIEGLPHKVGPSSSIGAIGVVNMLKTRTAERLIELRRAAGRADQPAFRRLRARARSSSSASTRSTSAASPAPTTRSARCRSRMTTSERRGTGVARRSTALPDHRVDRDRRGVRAPLRRGRVARVFVVSRTEAQCRTLVEAHRGRRRARPDTSRPTSPRTRPRTGGRARPSTASGGSTGCSTSPAAAAGGSATGRSTRRRAEGWDATFGLNLRASSSCAARRVERDARAGAGRAGPARRDPHMTSILGVPSLAGALRRPTPTPPRRARSRRSSTTMAAYYAPRRIRVNAVAPGADRGRRWPAAPRPTRDRGLRRAGSSRSSAG